MLFDDVEFGPYDKAEHNARRAYELYEDGKMAQALTELDRALEVNPTNSAWRFNKGLTLDAVNRFEEAIAEYETALQLCPDDLEILNALAVDYTRMGLYDRAISTFEYLQDLDPKFELGLYGKGMVMEVLGNIPEAKAAYRMLLTLPPESLDRGEIQARLARLDAVKDQPSR